MPGISRCLRHVRQADQPHHARADLVQLRRAERVGVVHVAEVRRVRRRPVERRPDAAGHRVRVRPVEVAVEAILAGPKLVVGAGVELVAAAPALGHEERGADVHDAVGRADGVGAGRRAAEIAEVRASDRPPGAKSRSSCAAMLFGRVCRTKLRNSGVSTVKVEPRAPDCRRPSYEVKKNSWLRDDRSAEAVAELVLVELRHRRLEHVAAPTACRSGK